ncbi:hypothetical protein RRG08_001910 [Elysia crispata]|nr:hypothetical protein RRG08_001910 [Elysia crispata]
MSYTSVVHTQILDIASSEVFMSYSSMVRTQFLDFASSTFFVSYNSVVHTQILDIASSEFFMSYSSMVCTQFLDFTSSAFFMRHTFMVRTQILDFVSTLKQTIPRCVLPKAISPATETEKSKTCGSSRRRTHNPVNVIPRPRKVKLVGHQGEELTTLLMLYQDREK